MGCAVCIVDDEGAQKLNFKPKSMGKNQSNFSLLHSLWTVIIILSQNNTLVQPILMSTMGMLGGTARDGKVFAPGKTQDENEKVLVQIDRWDG